MTWVSARQLLQFLILKVSIDFNLYTLLFVDAPAKEQNSLFASQACLSGILIFGCD